MSGVFQAARNFTTETFDTGTKALGLVSLSIDMADEKARNLHADVVYNCRAERPSLRAIAIVNAATAYCDRMEEFHRKNSPSTDFDRQACYDDHIAKIESIMPE